MAKRAVLIKPRKRTVRKTRSESYLVNLKYMGEEPVYDGPISDSLLGKALTWYNYMCELDDAREYIVEYFKSHKLDSDLKKFKRVPNAWVPVTSGWIFRIAMRGGQIDPRIIDRAIERIRTNYVYAQQEETTEQPVDRPSIQERIKDKTNDLIGDIEVLIDKGEPFSLYDHFTANQIPAKYMSSLLAYYAPICQEIVDMYKGRDEQLSEGFKHLNKNQKEALVKMYLDIVNDIKRYGSNVKKARTPRKKKAPSTEKLLKHFQYLKEYNEYKLKSVSPESIIGAQELWTFNSRNNVLSVFRAVGPAGLSVKRTSISGYDVDNSTSKRIGRKTEEMLNRVLTGGKIVLRKLMDEVKSEPTKISDRINTSVVLLKTVR